MVKIVEILEKSASKKEQLDILLSKLKGKSVYKNLKDIAEGKCKNKYREVIGVSSLLTHSLIEKEKGNNYNLLITVLYEKLGNLIYDLNRQ